MQFYTHTTNVCIPIILSSKQASVSQTFKFQINLIVLHWYFIVVLTWISLITFNVHLLSIFFVPTFFFLLLFRAASAAYGSCKDWGRIGATWDPSHICDLHHSFHLCSILNPLSEARGQTRILMDNRVFNPLATMVTPAPTFISPLKHVCSFAHFYLLGCVSLYCHMEFLYIWFFFFFVR